MLTGGPAATSNRPHPLACGLDAARLLGKRWDFYSELAAVSADLLVRLRDGSQAAREVFLLPGSQHTDREPFEANSGVERRSC